MTKYEEYDLSKSPLSFAEWVAKENERKERETREKE